MKEEFYCLPLKKKVKAKITTVVKKKSYALKGVHKVGDKTYNLNKTCSKARAEEVAAALGIEIEHTAAAETIVPEGSFLPEGSGNVIGQNTAGTETAIPATEETPTANTTPFHSDSEDKIGPMSMAAEVDTPEYKAARKERQKKKREDVQKTAPYLKVKDYEKHTTGKSYVLDVGLPSKVLLHMEDLENSGMKIDEIDTIQVHSQEGGRFPAIIDSRFKGKAAETEKKNCGCGKDPCITYGADGYKKSRSSSDEEEDVIEGAMEDEEADDIPQGFDPTDDKTVQFEDGTLMSPSKEAETGGVSYAIEPDHWLRLQAHRDWQATREEVNVERENNFWVITGPQESADDILDLIIDTADNTLADMTPVSSAGISKGVTLGIGMLGIAASIMLLQKFNKSD